MVDDSIDVVYNTPKSFDESSTINMDDTKLESDSQIGLCTKRRLSPAFAEMFNCLFICCITFVSLTVGAIGCPINLQSMKIGNTLCTYIF